MQFKKQNNIRPQLLLDSSLTFPKTLLILKTLVAENQQRCPSRSKCDADTSISHLCVILCVCKMGNVYFQNPFQSYQCFCILLRVVLFCFTRNKDDITFIPGKILQFIELLKKNSLWNK